MFGMEEKFDIVIANPPYVDSETMAREQPEIRDVYSKIYSTAKGNWDLYIPFLELGHNLLSENGVTSFITPNKWYAISYGNKIRDKLHDKIVRIANCNQVKVFEAGNSPVVTIFKKHADDENIIVDKFDNSYNIIEQTIIKNKTISDNFGIVFADNLSLICKIKSQLKTVKDYYKADNPCSVSEAYEIKKILEELPESDSSTNNYFLFVNTGTIDPFLPLWGIKITTYLKSKYKRPAINKQKFKQLFARRFNQTKQQKLIISGMRHFESFFDNEGKYIAGKSTEILINKSGLNLKVALAIFNTRLIRFFIKQNYNVLGIDGGINFTTDLIESLPFPSFDTTDKEKDIIKLVDNIVSSQDKKLIQSFQLQLDKMAYKLYGLTEEEIKIVETN
jgi:hypothetical protein